MGVPDTSRGLLLLQGGPCHSHGVPVALVNVSRNFRCILSLMEWPLYSPLMSSMDFGILGIIKTQVHVKNPDMTILTQFYVKKTWSL